jgi:hypothetical protein
MPGLRGMDPGDFREGGTWRSEAFLHQLSLNGSLLLLPNHDRIWQESFWRISGRPETGWSTERLLLQRLPASTVRRALWQTSYQWWLALLSYRRELADYCLQRGMLDEPLIDRLDRDLLRSAENLERLRWCVTDNDSGPIEVIRG